MLKDEIESTLTWAASTCKPSNTTIKPKFSHSRLKGWTESPASTASHGLSDAHPPWPADPTTGASSSSSTPSPLSPHRPQNQAASTLTRTLSTFPRFSTRCYANTSDRDDLPGSLSAGSPGQQKQSETIPSSAATQPKSSDSAEPAERILQEEQGMREDGEDQESLAEAENLSLILQKPMNGWSDACLRYLELVCKQVEAVKVTHPHPPRSKDKSLARTLNLLSLLQLRAIEASPSFRDVSIESVHGSSEELEEDGKLPSWSATALRTWIFEHTKNGQEGLKANGGVLQSDKPHIPNEEDWTQLQFRGTMHCEAILLSLHALTLDGMLAKKAPSPKEITKGPADSGRHGL
ncbi:hypothetical protein H2200_001317 [Cladophialophora chaetospira]|uniref:Uncharacterized protein n=1 Tax=Cladophialophora chaetospira TaxID=386627 RepID=A0AA38XKS6_9EURO|nr:hypothetical protein H2200_001317 [Cladophialophora chaetospira]